MIDALKIVIKNAINFIGLDVRRLNLEANPGKQLVKTLDFLETDLVLDVGANIGQFAKEIRASGYAGEIISFEPLSTAHAILEKTSKSDGKWCVYSRCALGDQIGEVKVNIAANSASSSLLPMLDSHLSAAPHSYFIDQEVAPLFTLDSVATNLIAGFKSIFLKIDTQGFEWAVLDGAKNITPYIRGISIELSLTPLYEGQRLWREILDRLEFEGFLLWAIQPEFIDPNNGRTLQINGIFLRTSELEGQLKQHE